MEPVRQQMLEGRGDREARMRVSGEGRGPSSAAMGLRARQAGAMPALEPG